MTESDPKTVSPPTEAAPAVPPPAEAPAPDETISPVHRTGSFPHKTSPAVATRTPFIDTNTPSINNAPVELDGVPTSPNGKTRERKGSIISPGLGEEEDINEEFLGDGEKGAGREIREKRAAMLASRSKDPGVIVDVPSDPTAEEVEAAKSAEGSVTPAVPKSAVEGEVTKR